MTGKETIPAGSTTANHAVTVIDDLIVEGDGIVVVTLTGVRTCALTTLGASNTATVTITDNDTASVSIAAVSQAAEPSTNGLFTVTMANPSSTATVDRKSVV